ncbi:MAG: hypothetical protein ABL878_10330 [Burkholderiales bacterium]
MRLKWWWLCGLMACAAQAAETGYTLKPTEIKEQPFIDSTTLVTVPEKTQVEIVARQGAWMQVKTREAKQGWVRMLTVRLGTPDQKPVRGNLLSALGFNRPRPSSSSTATVTTGVRGFSEEDLAKATPNPAEAAKMKGYSVTASAAAQFAESGKLTRKPISYFDEDGRPLKENK